MAQTLITGGTIVTAADTYRGDVLIDGDKVAAIGKSLKAPGAKRINATGKYVIPGGIERRSVGPRASSTSRCRASASGSRRRAIRG